LGQKQTFGSNRMMSACGPYMDPARLEQADWIRCNRHNC
jgi:hypothetical protein